MFADSQRMHRIRSSILISIARTIVEIARFVLAYWTELESSLHPQFRYRSEHPRRDFPSHSIVPPFVVIVRAYVCQSMPLTTAIFVAIALGETSKCNRGCDIYGAVRKGEAGRETERNKKRNAASRIRTYAGEPI